MAGVEFSAEDTAQVAGMLAATGIDLVEVGMVSGHSCADAAVIRAAHEAIGPERCLTLVVVRDRKQVAQALAEARGLGCQSLMLSIATSAEHARLKLASDSTDFLIALARAAIDMAKTQGFHVTFSGEDGARTEPERLHAYVAAGFAAGADRFRLAETVASLLPWRCAEIISDLVGIDGAEIEMHSHNMLGMAIANSLAAYEAGADWISTTVGGVGERGGNAPLAELLCALRVIYGDDRYDLSHLTALTETVLPRTRLGSAFMSGPTTPHAFAYELPGQLNHPQDYETIAPDEVGNVRELRVRTRVSPALVSWALDGANVDVDLPAFCDWLIARQKADGSPLLDRDAIVRLCGEFVGAAAR
jgi:isopropylmalate/homocitrate/citramalate synthase